MAVHAEGIEQTGSPDLGSQQGHLQLHQAGLAVFPMQIQLAGAHPLGIRALGIASPAVGLGQEAVDKMQLGLLKGVDQGILRGGRSPRSRVGGGLGRRGDCIPKGC